MSIRHHANGEPELATSSCGGTPKNHAPLLAQSDGGLFHVALETKPYITWMRGVTIALVEC